ncbi:hypothetical protein SMACR_04718 [Sordaria macrospora]|uniref:Uncharacterized protein n=1 Tax=Sordaria macrospora TaxID=5147 RepID=A0A8S8ZII7_SORMA|nr:hypothetical protein SMACR_04718 [Sordaria macrospora]WPJ61992.1 hypothetical protein SMAC4_04718 [Sordaria macrospora]
MLPAGSSHTGCASAPVLGHETAFETLEETIFVPVQDSALVEQVKAPMKQNADLAALLKESTREADVMTKNAEKAKKKYLTPRKANNRPYEEINAFVGHLAIKHDETREAVSDLNAAMHFVLERDTRVVTLIR